MRVSRHIAAAMLVALVLPCTVPTAVRAQDTIVVTQEPSAGCGCRNVQEPPWHGTVAGCPCGPSCPAPTMFHADPRGQLCMRRQVHHCDVRMPPCFPRLHGMWVYGQMPTPRPVTIPRCPQCGATIEGGF